MQSWVLWVWTFTCKCKCKCRFKRSVNFNWHWQSSRSRLPCVCVLVCLQSWESWCPSTLYSPWSLAQIYDALPYHFSCNNIMSQDAIIRNHACQSQCRFESLIWGPFTFFSGHYDAMKSCHSQKIAWIWDLVTESSLILWGGATPPSLWPITYLTCLALFYCRDWSPTTYSQTTFTSFLSLLHTGQYYIFETETNVSRKPVNAMFGTSQSYLLNRVSQLAVVIAVSERLWHCRPCWISCRWT